MIERLAAAARVSLAALALAGAAAGPPRATAAVAPVIEGTAHQALYAVAFDGAHGAAVGAAGQILLTRNGGQEWTQAKETGGTTLSLLGVDLRGDDLIAVGQAGLILVSQGGEIWQPVTAVTPERLFAVSLNSHGKAVAVGAFGTLIESTDHGRAWHAMPPADTAPYADQGADPHWYAVSVDEAGLVTVAGEFGLILRTADDGAHWTVAHKGVASLFGLDVHGGVGYAVGQAGTILRTRDGGATWSDSASNSNANLLAVSAGADGKVVVTAMNSVLASDDGTTWRAVVWGDFGSSWYAGVRFVDPPPATAILVGHAGRILRMNP